VTKVSIEFAEKEDRKQKSGYEYKTKHKDDFNFDGSETEFAPTS